MNYYDVLEVSPKASPAVLKAAYKSLMQRYHPDRNPGDEEAAERSKLIVQAFQVLSDAGQRAAYDAHLKLQTERAMAMSGAVGEAMKHEQEHSRPVRWTRSMWLALALGAVALWALWPSARHPGGTLRSESASSQQWAGDAPAVKINDATVISTARSIPDYIENLRVTLVPAADSTGAKPNGSQHTLVIQSIGVVVGQFDAEAFIAFLEQNRDYIAHQLAERLATTSHERLVEGRERYLKRLILDALTEITKTTRKDDYTFPGTAAAARYGAVEILLPDSFAVESETPGQAMVQVWSPN